MKGRKRLSGLLPSWLKNRRINELNHDEVGMSDEPRRSDAKQQPSGSKPSFLHHTQSWSIRRTAR